MKKWVYVSFIAISLVQVPGVSAAPVEGAGQTAQPVGQAAAPTLVRLEGALTTATGEARTGDVVLVVSLYSDTTDTTPLWTEQQLVTLDAAGRYAIMAGGSQPGGMPTEFFSNNSARWIGVAVQGEAEQPRVQILSVPYAAAAGNATTLAGKTPSDFVLVHDLANSVKSTLKAEGVSTPNDPESVQTSTVNKIAKFTDTLNTTGDSNMTDFGGNIGIGFPTPQRKLVVDSGGIVSQGFVATSGFFSYSVGNAADANSCSRSEARRKCAC